MITLSAARNKPSAAMAAKAVAGFAANCETNALPVTLIDYLQTIRSCGSRHHYERNETVFNQDNPADQVYRIISGTIRLCRNMPGGRRYIVDFLLPGDVTGFVESADQPVSAEAVTEVTLIAYPKIYFDKLARENPDVRKQLLLHMSENLLSAQQHLFVLGCQKAKERIASFLLRLADRTDTISGDRIDLAMNRQDIADHLGLTIETISRAITSLRDDGSILVPNAHEIVIRDLAAMRALAAED